MAKHDAKKIQSLLTDAKTAIDASDGFAAGAVILRTDDGNFVVIKTPGMTDEDIADASGVAL